MKKTIFAFLLALFSAFPMDASAFITYSPQEKNTVGLYLGSQLWQSNISSRVSDENDLINFNDQKEQKMGFFFAVEHPFSTLPNIRVSSTYFDISHWVTSTENFSFTDAQSGASYDSVIDSEFKYRFNVSYIDYTLYYKLLDERTFSLDVGFTARDFSGSVNVDRNVKTVTTWRVIAGSPDTTTHTHNTADIIMTDHIEPMLYLASDISLPIKGVSIFAKGDFLLKSDKTISDYQAGLGYALFSRQIVSVNAALGYRVVKMEFKNSNNVFNTVKAEGCFISFSIHF